MNEFRARKNVLIIAEGFEEKLYIDKLLSFPKINKKVYHFADTVNVKGNGNIPARYQYELQRGYYDVILVFCDADRGRKQFVNLVETIGENFFADKSNGIKVFIFANPVTLQIVLSHFGTVALKNVAKKINAKTVEKMTGIKNYRASQAQIEEMVNKIHSNSVDKFKQNLQKISRDFNEIPSTNFLTFLERFESDDTSWIDDINSLRKK